MNSNLDQRLLILLTVILVGSVIVSGSARTAFGTIEYSTSSLLVPYEKGCCFVGDGPRGYAHFEVYRPAQYEGDPMPAVVLIHGVGGSKEMMYPLGIELARLNYTVISVDLHGHGESTLPYMYNDFFLMSRDVYDSLLYVGDTYSDVNVSNYAVIAHSMGVGVAFALTDVPFTPRAVVAIGSTGELGFEEPSGYEGNLLYAIGSWDELVPTDVALDALRGRIGDEDAEPGVTYGSIEAGNATKLIFVPTEHIFEVVDTTILKESIIWVTDSLVGEESIDSAILDWTPIFQYKFFAESVGGVALAVSVIPLLHIISSMGTRVHKLGEDKKTREYRPLSLGYLVIFGLATGVIWITAIFLVPFSIWPSMPMFSTSILLFFIGLIALELTLVLGHPRTSQMPLENHHSLRSALTLLFPLMWIVGWVGFGQLVGFEPRIIFPLFRWFDLTRVLAAMVLIPISIVYSYGLLLTFDIFIPRKRANLIFNVRKLSIVVMAYIIGLAGTATILVILLTYIGNITGPLYLTGLLTNYFLVASLYTSVLMMMGHHEKQSRGLLATVTAIILIWSLLSSLPLV